MAIPMLGPCDAVSYVGFGGLCGDDGVPGCWADLSNTGAVCVGARRAAGAIVVVLQQLVTRPAGPRAQQSVGGTGSGSSSVVAVTRRRQNSVFGSPRRYWRTFYSAADGVSWSKSCSRSVRSFAGDVTRARRTARPKCWPRFRPANVRVTATCCIRVGVPVALAGGGRRVARGSHLVFRRWARHFRSSREHFRGPMRRVGRTSICRRSIFRPPWSSRKAEDGEIRWEAIEPGSGLECRRCPRARDI